MVFEHTMIVLDNSDHMRNGDYNPTRLGAQQDAALMVIGRRLGGSSHPENTVGVVSMAKSVEVLSTPTREQSRLRRATDNLQAGGKIKLAAAVKIAALALKHRPNKAGSVRIVLFVGSPVEEEDALLKKLGKVLKKDDYALDVVLMGEVEQNEKKLEQLVNAADKSGNSNLIVIPPGVLPSNILLQTHLCTDGATGQVDPTAAGGAPGAGGGGTGGADRFAEYGGYDPSVDPEMATVMRMSLMEERQRQERSVAESAGGDGAPAQGDAAMTDAPGAEAATPAPGGAAATPAAPTKAPAAAGDDDEDDEEDDDEDDEDDADLLAMALAMSKAPASSPASEAKAAGDDEDEDAAALAAALKMSTDAAPAIPPATSGAGAAAAAAAGAPADPSAAFFDPNFVQGLLTNLPGVDMQDPRILAALASMPKGGEEGKKKEDEKK